MSTQGNWSGDYQGEWFGSTGAAGPDYKIAGLVVTGTGTAQMTAEVINQPPVLPGGGGGGGGHVGAAETLRKRKEFNDFFNRITAKPLLTEADYKELQEELGATQQTPIASTVKEKTEEIREDEGEIAAILLLLL